MDESYNLDNITKTNCDEPNWYSYISYGLNVVLLITTIVSEWMGNSKCTKSNGIVDGIKRSVSRRMNDVNSSVEDKIKNTILNNTELIFKLVEKIQAMKEPPLNNNLNNVEVTI
tara:strand:+ start:481 stop:822 length:342 start_codon:yes stop_codon:yes gene_type:complete